MAPPVSQPFRPGHEGVDYAAPCSTPLGAPFDGRIVMVLPNLESFGWQVWIRSASKPREVALVAHMQAGSIVVIPGQRVRAGEYIGRSGNTGHVKGNGGEYFRGGPPGVGCHVHYGVRRGVKIDSNGKMSGGYWIEPSRKVGALFKPRATTARPGAPPVSTPGARPRPDRAQAIPAGIPGLGGVERFFTFTLPQLAKITGGAALLLVALAIMASGSQAGRTAIRAAAIAAPVKAVRARASA